MIDLDNYHLIVPGNPDVDSISHWEVWFQTPMGLFGTFEEAKTLCLAHDWLPSLMIVPVPVALDHEGRYEISMKVT